MYELLEEKNYWATYKKPYKFSDVMGTSVKKDKMPEQP